MNILRTFTKERKCFPINIRLMSQSDINNLHYLPTLTRESELWQVCQSGGNDVRPFTVQAMQKRCHKLTGSSENNYGMFEQNILLLYNIVCFNVFLPKTSFV